MYCACIVYMGTPKWFWWLFNPALDLNWAWHPCYKVYTKGAHLKGSLSHFPTDTCHIISVGGEALLTMVYGATLGSLLNTVPQNGHCALFSLLHLSKQNGHSQYCCTCSEQSQTENREKREHTCYALLILLSHVSIQQDRTSRSLQMWLKNRTYLGSVWESPFHPLAWTSHTNSKDWGHRFLHREDYVHQIHNLCWCRWGRCHLWKGITENFNKKFCIFNHI